MLDQADILCLKGVLTSHLYPPPSLSPTSQVYLPMFKLAEANCCLWFGSNLCDGSRFFYNIIFYTILIPCLPSFPLGCFEFFLNKARHNILPVFREKVTLMFKEWRFNSALFSIKLLDLLYFGKKTTLFSCQL